MSQITTKNQALFIFNILGIKDTSSKRQLSNGTNEYTLPFKRMFANGVTHTIKFATYESGYVRNTSTSNRSSYQINKTVQVPKSEDRYLPGVERVLIPCDDDRVIFLANYILKNYYRDSSKLQCDEWTRGVVGDMYNKPQPEIETEAIENIQVIIDGHRYNL